MPPENHEAYPAEWLRIAEKDMERVERLLADEDPDLAGFCLQQAIEKFLKAFLLARGWRLRRTHDLEALLDDAVLYDATFESHRAACGAITKYYVVERYPGIPMGGPAAADVRQAMESVEGLVRHIRAAFP